MAKDIRIALDAMGGDHGPAVVVPGAAIALERRPDTQYLLYGDEKAVGPILAVHPKLAARARLFHTSVAVKMTDKPSQALRTGRRVSSMWQALEAVKTGAADCAVSAGNTGALMAMAKFCLHTMAPVDRPAIAALWPTLRGESIVLDVGATIGGDERHLVDLAVMGAAMARIVFDIDSPTVGLLNVGVEEIKGVETVKAAGRMLREANLPNMLYHGFVEGDDLGRGAVDVFVTEGFTGNIALKTAEGTARQLSLYLRDAMSHSLMSRIGFLFARKALMALRDKMSPRASGGVFLGLDGVVIKAHGGADAEAYAGAIELGFDMVRQELMGKISRNDCASQRRPSRRRAIVGGPVIEERIRSMTSLLRSRVRGVGAALPARIVTNAELAGKLDTSDEWIQQRTGIKQRYIAGDGETTASLAARAAEAALRHAGLAPSAIDLVVVATSTPDYTFPSVATLGPGEPRHRRRRGFRPAGGLHRLRLCGRRRRQVPAFGLQQARAGDRRRDVLAYPRLERPHDLRPVRRRRWRDRARGD